MVPPQLVESVPTCNLSRANESSRARMRATVRVLVTPAKKMRRSIKVQCPPTASTLPLKKFGTSARPGGSFPKQWMDYTPVLRASEETNQNRTRACRLTMSLPDGRTDMPVTLVEFRV
jgi:hypothetical protein